MITLFIDTSTDSLNIGLIKNDDLLSSITLPSSEHSKYAMTAIEKLFSDNNIDSKNVDKIMVVNGPGSFTGIRIGVTIAKTLAYCTNSTIYTIDSLTLASLSYTGDNYIAVKENNGIYLAKFHNENITSSIEYYRNKETEYLTYKDDIKYERETPNFDRLIEIMTKLPKCNAFNANPIYIKSIEALNDK